jgi:hypothetical protein
MQVFALSRFRTGEQGRGPVGSAWFRQRPSGAPSGCDLVALCCTPPGEPTGPSPNGTESQRDLVAVRRKTL